MSRNYWHQIAVFHSRNGDSALSAVRQIGRDIEVMVGRPLVADTASGDFEVFPGYGFPPLYCENDALTGFAGRGKDWGSSVDAGRGVMEIEPEVYHPELALWTGSNRR